MDFEWDDRKNQLNINKHGIDFTDAARLLDHGPVLVNPSEFLGEERFVAIGKYQGRYLAIVYTMRGGSVYRIISARAARVKEKEAYEEKSRKDS